MKRLCAAVLAFAFLFLFGNKLHIEAEGEGEKLVALTFDDGPHPRYTDEVLAVLDKYGVKATFFMIGINITYWPQVAKRVHMAGHEIGNHTFTHPHLKQLGEEALLSEIEDCNREIAGITQKPPLLFRPPEGAKDTTACRALAKKGITPVMWSIDTNDWRGGKPPLLMAKEILKQVKGGDIILCHDYITGDYTTPRALDIVIPQLQKSGYRFVTVSELLGG